MPLKLEYFAILWISNYSEIKFMISSIFGLFAFYISSIFSELLTYTWEEIHGFMMPMTANIGSVSPPPSPAIYIHWVWTRQSLDIQTNDPLPDFLQDPYKDKYQKEHYTKILQSRYFGMSWIWLIDWVGVWHPMSTLATIRDAHVKDMRWAVCSSSSWSQAQKVKK